MGGDQHDPVGAQVGDDRGVPVGEHPRDHVLEALRRGHLVAEVGVPDVAGLGELVVGLDRRGRYVEGAAPEHELLLAVLLERLLLVLALERAVVPLVEPPRAAHRDPRPAGRFQRELGRPDRAPQHRGVHDVRQHPVLLEQLAGEDGLRLALRAQAYVDPAGEEPLVVPRALAVAQ